MSVHFEVRAALANLLLLKDAATAAREIAVVPPIAVNQSYFPGIKKNMLLAKNNNRSSIKNRNHPPGSDTK
jgi:hypothetical protein